MSDRPVMVNSARKAIHISRDKIYFKRIERTCRGSGGAIARVITDHLPDVEATAEVTAASVNNLKTVRNHKSDIAFTLADTLDDAVAGRGAFARKGPVPARVLAVLYDNYTHLVATGSSGVARVADLAGKHVSIGAAGGGTELIATRMLRAAGLDPAKDIRPVSLGVAQSVDALKDGKIDAFFWSGGVQTAAVLDLAGTPDTRWRLLSNDEQQQQRLIILKDG